mmetsp:Transcript_85144/g.264537  ORF Transcript_85144/g.264537 Transcript_85144/m.264537 type:complete len:235 (-) Transcript_85144:1213-1917(-)
MASGTPAMCKHLDEGPFKFATTSRCPRELRVSAKTSSISQPVRSTWLMDFASTTTKPISSPMASRTLIAFRQNSFNFRAFTKLSLASSLITTTLLMSSASRKFLMSRNAPSGSLPQTAMLGLLRSYIVFSTDNTKPTRSPSFTERASDVTKVANMTANSARLALKATMKAWKSRTPMAPWMMMGARAASGSSATKGRSSKTATNTSTEDRAQATKDVAPKDALTAVLENEPVVG